MKTRIQIAFGNYQWMLIYVGMKKMSLKMLEILYVLRIELFLDYLKPTYFSLVFDISVNKKNRVT